MSIYKDGLAVVLFSGGLDSTVAMYDVIESGYRVLPLFVNYGQRNMGQELTASMDIVGELGRGRSAAIKMVSINFGTMFDPAGGDKRTDQGSYIPSRNLVLSSLGVSYAEHTQARAVVLGLHAGSRYPDCQYTFVMEMQRVAQQATYLGGKLSVLAPLMDMSKKELVQRGQDLQVPFELTFSCEAPKRNGEACGTCNACRDRQDAMFGLSSKVR